jgi:hypothetical protein
MAIREQVSGPGSNSKRTDLNVSRQPARYMAGGSYGEGQELMGLQQGATMAGPTPNMVGGGRGGMSKPISSFAATSPITQLTAPTERPNEPQTAGMPFGPGTNFISLPPSNQRTPATVAGEMLNNPQIQDIAGVAEIFSAIEGQGKGFGY